MNTLKDRLYELIFEADTKKGKVFDVALLLIILASVVLVMLESVPVLRKNHLEFFLKSNKAIRGFPCRGV